MGGRAPVRGRFRAGRQPDECAGRPDRRALPAVHGLHAEPSLRNRNKNQRRDMYTRFFVLSAATRSSRWCSSVLSRLPKKKEEPTHVGGAAAIQRGRTKAGVAWMTTGSRRRAGAAEHQVCNTVKSRQALVFGNSSQVRATPRSAAPHTPGRMVSAGRCSSGLRLLLRLGLGLLGLGGGFGGGHGLGVLGLPQEHAHDERRGPDDDVEQPPLPTTSVREGQQERMASTSCMMNQPYAFVGSMPRSAARPPRSSCRSWPCPRSPRQS